MKENNLIQKIKKITAGNKKVERELIDIIIRQTSLQSTQIESSLHKADWMELKRLAHKIQSTFTILKMERAKKLAEIIVTTEDIKIRKTKKDTLELISICREMLAELNTYLKK